MVLKLCILLYLLHAVRSEATCGTKADVIFLLDGSESILDADFKAMKNFTKKVIETFTIGENKVQVAVRTFGTTVNVPFNLNSYKTKKALLNAVDSVKRAYGKTNTGAALKELITGGFTSTNGHNSTTPKIAIMITDGVSSNPKLTKEAAVEVRNAGIKVYAVGVGAKDLNELSTIAYNNHSISSVAGYPTLQYHASSVSSQVCLNFANRADCKKFHKADIVFLLDSSAGVGKEDFNKMKAFVKNITKEFLIGKSFVQIGAATYGTDAKTVFRLKDFQTADDINKALDRHAYVKGESHSHEGLKLLREDSFLSSSGARDSNVEKVAIVIMEGFSNRRNKTAIEAAKLKSSGVKVFAINVGDTVDDAELNTVASSDEEGETKYVFRTMSYDMLDHLKPLILKDVCTAQLSSCMGKSDVVFLLDSSCSVGEDNFAKMKLFVNRVTDQFYIHEQGIQVGVESFECKQHTQLKLNTTHNKVQIKHAVSNIKYTPGGTNTGDALKYIRERSFQPGNGGRTDVKRIGILITDGDSKNKAKTFYEAHNARQKGIKLVAVGVGVEDTKEITGIASRSDTRVETYLFQAKNYESLFQLYRNVSAIACAV